MLKRLLTICLRSIPKRFIWRLVWFFSPKFNIGVVGIITNSEGEVLLIKHVFRYSNPWGLPSGFANPNETFKQAIKREVKEEVNLTVDSLRVLEVRSGFKLRVEAVLSGEYLNKDEDIKFSLETLDMGFFKLDDLPGDMNVDQRKILEKWAKQN